jgi:SRSO17 transposase
VPAAWVVGDEVYGGDSKFRFPLEDRGHAYVLAVRANQPTSTWPPYGPPCYLTVADVGAAVPADAWCRLSCGVGAQGPRVYDWAYAPVRPALRDGTWVHAVLLRRHPERPDEVAFYLVHCSAATQLAEVVRAVGARWTIDDAFKRAKGQVGLDQYDVRSWRGWHRHVTLAMLALAVLTVAGRRAGKGGRPRRAAARSTSRSSSPKSAGSSSASSEPPPARPPSSARSWPGPAGGAGTRRPRSSATSKRRLRRQGEL